MVPARYYSSGPIHIQHGDGGHNINQHEIRCFATTVATNNNASNAMRADNSRDRHEGYANSMRTIQNVKNALNHKLLILGVIVTYKFLIVTNKIFIATYMFDLQL